MRLRQSATPSRAGIPAPTCGRLGPRAFDSGLTCAKLRSTRYALHSNVPTRRLDQVKTTRPYWPQSGRLLQPQFCASLSIRARSARPETLSIPSSKRHSLEMESCRSLVALSLGGYSLLD